MEMEEKTTIEVNNPGAYSTVCVEMDMSSLAVNTVIEVNDYYYYPIFYSPELQKEQICIW